VPLCGGLQPSLTGLLGDEGDGFRPRFLPHLAPAAPAGAPPRAFPPRAWADALRELLEHRRTERRWEPQDAAYKLGHELAADWKRRAADAASGDVAAALSKADRHLARIALVLRELERAGTGGSYGPRLLE
jgi:hypothetical protein